MIMALIVLTLPILVAFAMDLPIFDSVSGSNDGWLGFWGGYLGAIVAIGGVYWQVEEQRKEFQSNRTAQAKVAAGLTSITIKDERTNTFTVKEGFVEFWAINVGYMPGSFMFLGVTDEKTYNNLESENDGSKRDKLLQKVLELDFDYTKMGTKRREFELLSPNQVSKRVIYSITSIKRTFKKDNTVYAIYMNPLGEIYGAGILIRKENIEKDKDGDTSGSKK